MRVKFILCFAHLGMERDDSHMLKVESESEKVKVECESNISSVFCSPRRE